jgi:hypothetical protein
MKLLVIVVIGVPLVVLLYVGVVRIIKEIITNK